MKLSKRKICSVILSISIIAATIAIPAYGDANKNFVPQMTAIDGNENQSFAIGELSEESGETPEKIVERNYNKKLVGSDDKKQKGFKIVKKSKNSMGRTVISTVQTFNGFSVYGTDQNYHVNNAGVIECIAGSNVDDIENKVISMNFSAKYSQEDVLKAIENHLGFAPDYEVTPKPEIILYPISGKYHYVYEVEVEASSPRYISCTYYFDANDLSVMSANGHIHSINDNEIPVQGSGVGQSGVEKDLKMVYNTTDGKYYLKNTVDNFKTSYGWSGWLKPDIEREISQFNPAPTIIAPFSYTDDKFDSGDDEAINNEDWNVIYQRAAVDAHSNVTKIINFFKNAPFYRNRQADNDAENIDEVYVIEQNEETNENIKMHVLISTNEPTGLGSSLGHPTAWGSKNYLGIHCHPGENGKIISACLDVLAHEYTHGILEFEGLTGLQPETRAVHEGVGDVFGILAEYFITNDYSVQENGLDETISGLIAEDIYFTGYLRDAFDPEIKTYAAYDAKENATQNDGGGLISRASGLMALGGENVNAIEYGKIAHIFYNAINDGYLTQETNLKQFANYVVQSARLLYGANSQECKSTKDAFFAVGLLDTPPTNFTCTNFDDITVNLAWNGETGKNVGVYRKSAGTTDEPYLFHTTSSTTGFTFNTLYGSMEYYIAYIDQSDIRTSAYSNAVNIERLTKNAPTNFRITNRSCLDIQFSWSGTTGEKFAVYRKISDTNDEFVKVGETTNKQITVDTFLGKCDFKVAVISSDGTRLSPFSNVYSIESYLDAPSNFYKESSTGSTATFSWNQHNDERVGRYAVYRVRPGTLDTPEKIGETKYNSLKVNLASGTYDYMVAIVDINGNRMSRFSNVVIVSK
ncbi:MAG: hypothetical protein GX660_23415 [Clostridiaceae bacterium]|nr:hypothetical protein [Clostridiaceae bacterium]